MFDQGLGQRRENDDPEEVHRGGRVHHFADFGFQHQDPGTQRVSFTKTSTAGHVDINRI